jgi:anti-sigma B factor antagonist
VSRQRDADPMEYAIHLEGDVAVIRPVGRITIGESAEAFGRAVHAAFASGASHLLVDCAKVPYADSSGIGELLGAMRRARESGGMVGLFGPRGKIHEILELTKLSGYFAIGRTEDDARAMLTQMTAARKR